jgi:hypothetical protein
MNKELLGEIQKLVWKLVNIANGDPKTKNTLSRREAYLAVRVMDLAEGFIGQVEDDRFIGGPINE